MCIDWKAVDISSVYNITDFEPDIIKEVATVAMYTRQCDYMELATELHS